MTANEDIGINAAVLQSEFVQQSANTPLRVCCYGSSSSETPEIYLTEARSLGYILGKRGHTCVNGAGAFGCMAAMNDGCYAADGNMVGVIHEMWLEKSDTLRDGGAHRAFISTENANANATYNATTRQGGKSPTVTAEGQSKKREILVAGGKDLQERKRMLVDKADALVVLPGGPGTWDELWEMACARGIGLTNLPIVCVNCDGFYDPFHDMLKRAYSDKLTKLQPCELVHFEPTAEAAVRWVERVALVSADSKVDSRSTPERTTSFFHTPVVQSGKTSRGMAPQPLLQGVVTKLFGWFFVSQPSGTGTVTWPRMTWVFAAGVTVGAALASTKRPSKLP